MQVIFWDDELRLIFFRKLDAILAMIISKVYQQLRTMISETLDSFQIPDQN